MEIYAVLHESAEKYRMFYFIVFFTAIEDKVLVAS